MHYLLCHFNYQTLFPTAFLFAHSPTTTLNLFLIKYKRPASVWSICPPIFLKVRFTEIFAWFYLLRLFTQIPIFQYPHSKWGNHLHSPIHLDCLVFLFSTYNYLIFVYIVGRIFSPLVFLYHSIPSIWNSVLIKTLLFINLYIPYYIIEDWL